jgi:hypothetical protein
MGAVPEFGYSLLCPLGAPKGRIRTFTEVQFRDVDAKLSTPDGAVVVEGGKKKWRALVEVKTGGAELGSEQVGRYLEMARDHGFDCLLTISNQITASIDESPVVVDRRKLRSVRMYHLSWWRIVTEAVLQHRFRGISDPDQAWILGELIAYLDHEHAGAGGFQDMGERWVNVRERARQGTLRSTDSEVRVIAERWEHFLEYIALGLSQDLGRDVAVARGRKQKTSERVDGLVQLLVANGELSGALRVPDTIAAVDLHADLRARQVVTSATFNAPPETRPLTRVNWLLRQLKDAPPDLRINATFASTREPTSSLLGDAREQPRRLLHPADPRRDPKTFTVALSRPMGMKRGKGHGSFVRETRRHVLDFYALVMQDLEAWQPRPPQLRNPDVEVPLSAQPDPPPFAAVDERDIGEGLDVSDPRVRDAFAQEPSSSAPPEVTDDDFTDYK